MNKKKGILVATSILKNRNKILILKRSEKVGSFQGYWSGCSGYVEENETPRETSLKEIREETGITEKQLKLLVVGIVHRIEKETGIWLIHPYLYETTKKEIKLDWENDEFAWIKKEELKKYKFVPELDKVIEGLFEKEMEMKKNV